MPLSATITALIGTFKDPVLKFCNDIKTEVEFFMDSGLSDYISSIENKFLFTKTFLYRNENVPFYDVFFPVSLKIGKEIKKVTSYEDLFKSSSYVSIIGIAGCGKTMLMKHFFLSAIKELFKIPIYIELRNLNDYEKSFTEYIYEHIFNNKLSPDKRILERLLESGEFILILDGYDEIYSEKKNQITNDLDKFIDRYSKNRYIISSRPGSGVEALPRFNNYFVQELNNKEVFSFIDLVLNNNDDNELADKIKIVIKSSFDSDYSNFLRSPLLLSMFILTFNTYPELPTKKSKFYWNVFDTLATKHDSFTKKGGYQHERKTMLQNEDFEKILQWFSFKSLFHGKLNFDSEYLASSLTEIKKSLAYDFSVNDLIEDLTLAISIIIVDGVEYKFPHKSLQEYFCAMLISQQSEDIKIRIYENKFVSHASSSTGGYENFWNLCYELDKISFIRFFLIPNLNKFKEEVFDVDVIEQLRKFYEFSGLGDPLVIKENNDILFSGGVVYWGHFAIYYTIFNYLKIGNLHSFVLNRFLNDKDSERLLINFREYILMNEELMENEKVGSDVEDLDEETDVRLYFTIRNHWQYLNKIISKSDYQFELNKIMKSLDEKLFDLNEKLKFEQNITNRLLNL